METTGQWSPCHKLLGGLAAAFLAERSIAMGRSEALERPCLTLAGNGVRWPTPRSQRTALV
eukprot:1795620-Prymnesium_polylepis.1